MMHAHGGVRPYVVILVIGVSACCIILQGCGDDSGSGSLGYAYSSPPQSSAAGASFDGSVPAFYPSSFPGVACDHVAGHAVERRRHSWTQTLWTACATYTRYKRVGQYLFDECLFQGVRVIRDADREAITHVETKCKQAIAKAASGSTDLTIVADAVFGEDGFAGPGDGDHFNGVHADRFASELDRRFYGGSVIFASQRADELMERFKAMSDADFEKYKETHEVLVTKEAVAHEWCLSITEHSFIDAMREKVLAPLIYSCRLRGVGKTGGQLDVAGFASSQSEACRRLFRLGTGGATDHGTLGVHMRNNCFQRGAREISRAVGKFRETSMKSCTAEMVNTLGKSFLQMHPAVESFIAKNINTSSRLYETLHLAIVDASKHDDCEMPGPMMSDAPIRREVAISTPIERAPQDGRSSFSLLNAHVVLGVSVTFAIVDIVAAVLIWRCCRDDAAQHAVVIPTVQTRAPTTRSVMSMAIREKNEHQSDADALLGKY